MKAVIVELKDKYAAALCENGEVVRVPNLNYHTGQAVNLKNENSTLFRRRMVAMAAAVVALVSVSGATAYAYTYPYSYVSLDVNPSITFTVNRFDKVLKAEAVDSDGQTVLDKLDLENKDITQAVSETIEEIKQEGYFSGSDQSGIIITTYSGDQQKSDELKNTIEKDAKDQLDDENVSANLEVVGVGRERVQEAQSMGVTPGKLNLVQKLQSSASDPSSVNVQEWLDKPVKDIMKEIKHNKKANPDAGDGSDEQPTPTSSSSPSQDSNTTDNQTQQSTPPGVQPGANASKEHGNSKNAKDKDKSENNGNGQGNWPLQSSNNGNGNNK